MIAVFQLKGHVSILFSAQKYFGDQEILYQVVIIHVNQVWGKFIDFFIHIWVKIEKSVILGQFYEWNFQYP